VYVGAAAWWNSSTTTTSKWSGSIASTRPPFRLWIDANTWLEVARPMVAHPQLTERGVAQRVPERRQALREDLLAVRDEQETRPRERHSQPAVVDRRHHRLAGPGRGDEQVAVMAVRTRHLDLSSSRSWNGRSVSSVGGRYVVVAPAAGSSVRSPELGSGRTARSRRPPSRSRTPPPSGRSPRGCGCPTPGRSTPAPGTIALWVRFDEPTYAVECPRARWNNHDFACRRVVVVSYDTRTCTPACSSA
jgi:hypothetical protein